MVYETDVLVIGAGIIGSAIAYNLAKEGVGVVVTEKEGIGEGTSGACDGFVILQSKSPGIHLELALESAKLYTDLAEVLDYDIQYKRQGGLILIESPQQLDVMKEVVAKQRLSGLEVDLIGGKEARELEPALSENIIAAAYSPLDGQVDPLYATIGYARAAQRLGAEFWKQNPVTSLEMKDGKIAKVITEKGEIKARWVINACGAWAPDIGRMLGLTIPIIPRRGQTLVTEPLAPIIKRVLLCARYIAIKHNPDIIKATADSSLKLGVGLSLEQADSGNILLGNNREFVGYDRGTTLEAVQAIANYAFRFAPFLQDVHIIRTFAGLRPYTPDGLPILGPVKGIDGFIMAAGHEGDGIALAPITGKLIAEYIKTGKTSFPLDAFRLERFSEEATA